MSFHKNFWCAIAAGLFVASNAAAQTELTVYTAIEAEDLKRYAETFNQEHPDIHINWVRDSTGIVTAKLLAEKNNPQADMVWGLAGNSLLLLKAEGMLEPYAPTVSATVSRRRQAWLRRCTPRVTRPWRMRTPAEV
jgi:iron(III) transport system substrate-binding protein